MILLALIIVFAILIFFVIAFFLATGVIAKVQIITSFNTIIILFIMLYLFYAKQEKYIDIALLYAILSFSSLLATAKYLKHNLQQNKTK